MTTTPARRVVCSTPVNLGLLLVRVPFGLFFLLAGFGKIRGGVGTFASAMIGKVPSFIPPSLGGAYLHALPFVELLTGLAVVVGLLTRVAGVLQALMLISFMMALGVKTNAGPFHYNFVYLGIALMLALVGPGEWSADRALFGRKGMTE
jgi:putative oxidoreductase